VENKCRENVSLVLAGRDKEKERSSREEEKLQNISRKSHTSSLQQDLMTAFFLSKQEGARNYEKLSLMFCSPSIGKNSNVIPVSPRGAQVNWVIP
jgi:hypothetical protein